MNITNAWQLIVEKLSVWTRSLIQLLPNMAAAALLLVLGIYLSKLIRRLARRFIVRISSNKTINELFTSFIYVLSLGITLFAVLSILKLEKAVTSILAGAGLLGLALAFAFQDIAANFISGIFIIIRRPLQVGDIIKSKDYMGTVETINLRDTVLRIFQGQMVIIPNKDILQNPIENYSLLGKRRLDLSVGISYGEDLAEAMRVTLEAAEKVSVRTDDEITMFYESFADSSINYVIRIWLNSPEQPVYLQGCSEAIMHIKKAYDEQGITIPFPIRTLDVDWSQWDIPPGAKEGK